MPRVLSSSCPNCHKVLDGATGVDDGGVNDDLMPDPGDATVCLYCGHLCIYGNDLRLRHPTSGEMSEIAGDPKMVAIVKARAKVFK